jgi:hypothetical protein
VADYQGFIASLDESDIIEVSRENVPTEVYYVKHGGEEVQIY